MAFELNASLPAPSLEQCVDLEDSARLMLRRAWENPKELGTDSKICSEATALLSEIRQYCSPRDEPDRPNPARENFHNALKLAWLAVWRARDYTASALAKRSEANGWRNRFTRGDVNRGLYDFDGAAWFPHHYPLYDANGEPTDRARLRFELLFNFQNEPEYYEGAMVSKADQVPSNPKLVLRWCCIRSGLPSREGGFAMESCFLEGESKLNSCGSDRIPLCKDLIALSPFELRKFANSSVQAISGSRFEAGLKLSGGFEDQFNAATLEVGEKLTLASCQLKVGLDLRTAPGVRSLLSKDTTIGGNLNFKGRSQLAVNLVDASVGSMEADEAILDSLHVTGLKIQNRVSFTGTKVQGRCQFSDVDFHGPANFQGATFVKEPSPNKDDLSYRHTWFRQCRFHQKTEFDGSSFGSVTFENTTFLADAYFRSTQFHGHADFRKTSWQGRADFSPGRWGPSRFLADVNFSHLDGGLTEAKLHWCSFVSVQFSGLTVFQNRRFMDETWFDRATFKRAPEFHGSKLHSKTFFSGTRFNWDRARHSNWFERACVARTLQWIGRPIPERTASDARNLLDVVNCFRVLTSLANEISAKDLAYSFHKQELRAKYRLPLANGVTRSEAFIGRVYGLLADYGDSFVRPLIGLIASIAVFGLAYASPFLPNDGRWSSAIATSAALQFRPVAALDPGFGRLPSSEVEKVCTANVASKGSVSTECMQYHLRKDHELAIKAASVGQTLLTFVFLFLTLLALRRKYQVS
jgi:uncharacterized protein YjbI with pentapeptide repeats